MIDPAHARDVIFVVGMGRSGSSALTRIIALCGAVLPDRMLPPNFGNPTGYWEPERAIEINDAFLLARSSSWYDPGLDLQLDPRPAAHPHFVAEIIDFLALGFPHGGPIVLKEPRISGLLPYWIVAARALGLTPKFVHLLRRPADVAASLASRDGLTAEDSFALWLKYNFVAERDARGARRIFVSFEDLMRDWEPVLARCIAELRLDVGFRDATKAAIGQFLSPALHHHQATRIAPGAVQRQLSRTVDAAYEVLLSARSGPVRTAELDAMFGDYVDALDAERRRSALRMSG